MQIFCGLTANAQEITVKGKVTDSETGEGIPFANVVERKSNQATLTDFEGYYSLKVNQGADSITVLFIGYLPKSKAINKNLSNQVLDFQISPEVKNLEEVTVVAGENPAFRILRKVIDNKDKNDYRRLDAYEYESYSKIELSIDNITEKFRKRKIMSKLVQVFDSLKIIAGDEGKPILPVFMSESVSKFYHRTSPDKTSEHIIATNVKGVGVDDGTLVSQLIGSTFQQYNFYKNRLGILNKDFISPISDGWNSSYNYWLVDSAFMDGKWCYKLEFKPKRAQDLAFNGFMWIADTTFALKQIDVTVNRDANLNYIDKIKIQQELAPTEAGPWLPVKSRILIDIDEVGETSPGMLAKFYTSNKKIEINKPKPLKFYDSLLEVEEDAQQKGQEYWQQNRHDSLTATEQNVYNMIDSVNNVPVVKTYVEIVNIFINGYKKVGKIDVGPYLMAYANNNIEGNRFRLGFRTNIDFSKKWVFKGYLAYGTKDSYGLNGFKYSAGASYIFSRKPWTVATIERKADIEQLGVATENITSNALFLAFTRWGTLRGPYWSEQNTFSFQSEIKKDFTPKIQLRTRYLNPIFPFAYYSSLKNGDSTLKSTIQTTELTLETRITKDEIFVQNDNERISLGTKKWPVLTIGVTQGIKGFLGGDFNYTRLNLHVNDMIQLGILGRGYYDIFAGKIFSKVPYPLLNIPLGNQTIFFTNFAYNQMNYFEFINDSYAGIKYRQYFEGLFFNRVPLLKKLKWRFVGSANVLFGGISKANKELIAKETSAGEETPQFNYLGAKPYVEVGYGIENIFKIFRVDFVHRLTYLNQPDVRKFGVKVSVQFVL
ncbi:hypothetical protein MYP_3471 [Sporocytophaga myxococcoides]|uniref:Outer membrane protein n=1 Tax=Sporocytophaga myxococcoides TaxID=153721 RepID=A0A098LIP2_9BACT|nr:DUF5686 and carboxypeptidase-like regulatory domain-containing protein [Sporocytophaga myxococcoides]GAL86242.1 hypothetical protein MYP_3471 [Sporocytophaga myxococcoides]